MFRISLADLLQHRSGGGCSHALFLFTKTGQLLKKLFGILRQTAIIIKNIIRGDVQQANHHKQVFKTGFPLPFSISRIVRG